MGTRKSVEGLIGDQVIAGGSDSDSFAEGVEDAAEGGGGDGVVSAGNDIINAQPGVPGSGGESGVGITSYRGGGTGDSGGDKGEGGE